MTPQFSISKSIVDAVKRNGTSQRKVAGAIGLCEPEVSRIANGYRHFTLPQIERLADDQGIPLWQLILHALREFDDPSKLNDYVARLADELSFALKRLQAQQENAMKSQISAETQPTAA